MVDDTASLPMPAPDTAGDEAGAPAVPRVLEFAMIKRIDPRLPNTWGHWWIELDGQESYGWWPTPCPMGWRGVLFGCGGTLNGIGTPNGGSATRDAYHGDDPDHCYHPTLVVAKSDEQVRADIRAFAHSYIGGFRWQWWWLREPGENCRTFQWAMFETVGLAEEPEYLHTRGSGCPFMYPFRRARWRAQDLATAAFAWLCRGRLAGRRPPRSSCPWRGTLADRPAARAEHGQLRSIDPADRLGV